MVTALLVAEAGLRLLPADRVGRLLGVPLLRSSRAVARPASLATVPVARHPELRMLGLVLAHRPFRSGSACLRESLGLGLLLRRWQPQLRLGVAREGPSLRAHVWVEADGYSFLADAAFLPLGGHGGRDGT